MNGSPDWPVGGAVPAPPAAERSPGARLARNLAVVAGLLFALRSLILAVHLSTPVPNYDQWEFVADLVRLRDGQYGWLDLFAQHNEHRIFTARLSFFLDYYLFHLGNLSVVLTNYAVLAVLAAVLAAVATRGRPVRDKVLVLAWTLPAMWSVAGWINLGWGFELQWAYVHLLPALSIVLFAAATQRFGVACRVLLAASCLCDVLGVFSMSSGLVTFVPVAAVAIWLRARPKLLVAYLMAHAAFVGLFLWGYVFPPHHLVLWPPALARYVVPYLGTAFPGSKQLAILVGSLGVLLALAAAALATWRVVARRVPLEPSVAVLLAVAMFVVVEGVATAIGRAGLPNPTALALRYGEPSEIFWAALLLFAWRALARDGRHPAARAVAALSILAVIASNTMGDASGTWANWSRAIDNEAFGLINEVTTGPSVTMIYPVPDNIQDRIAFLRERQLGPFAEQEVQYRAPLNSLSGADPAQLPACRAAPEQFDVAETQAHVRGRAEAPGEAPAARWVVALDADRHVRGFTRAFADPGTGGPAASYDVWFPVSDAAEAGQMDLVAIFPGGTAPLCRVPRRAPRIVPPRSSPAEDGGVPSPS